MFVSQRALPTSLGGLPKPGALKVSLPNDHLGYALTWFGLALVLVAVFGFWARGRPLPCEIPGFRLVCPWLRAGPACGTVI